MEIVEEVHLTSQHKRTTRLIILSTATTEFSKTVSLQFKKRRRFFTNTLVHDVKKYLSQIFYCLMF